MIITHYLFWIVGFLLIMALHKNNGGYLLLFIIGAIFSSSPALLPIIYGIFIATALHLGPWKKISQS